MNVLKLSGITRCRLCSIAFIFILALPAWGNEAISTLDSAIQHALKVNPTLSVYRENSLALTKIPEQVSALPEPRLKFNAMNLPINEFSLSQTPMTQIQLGVSQMLPYPGKLALKKRDAEHMAKAADHQTNNFKRILVLKITELWWNGFYMQKALESNLKNQELIKQFTEVAETNYSIGHGKQEDIFHAQLELSQMQNNYILLEGELKTIKSKLNTLLARSVDSSVQIPVKAERHLSNLKDITEYLTTAKTRRSDFKALTFTTKSAKTRVELARKNYFPDFQVSAVYGWREEENDLASIQLSLNLPINVENRQDPLRDQRTHEWIKQKNRSRELLLQIESEINQAIIDHDQASKQVELLGESIIPQARQSVDALLAGYQVNKTNFVELVRAQINLFNVETQFWKSLIAGKKAKARLDAATGKGVNYE